MNKRQFAAELAARTGRSQSETLQTVNAALDILTEQMLAREKVQFSGFGTFEARQTPQRVARNPITKEQILIPARYKPCFKAGKTLQGRVNGKSVP